MADVVRDAYFAWGAWTWARLQSEYGKRQVYLYYFDEHAPQYPPAGSPHTAEIGYVFDNLGAFVRNGVPVHAPTPANDPTLATMMSGYWVNFARTGDPNGPGLPAWPAFNTATQQVMVFDARPSARPLPNQPRLEALDTYFRRRREEPKKKPIN